MVSIGVNSCACTLRRCWSHARCPLSVVPVHALPLGGACDRGRAGENDGSLRRRALAVHRPGTSLRFGAPAFRLRVGDVDRAADSNALEAFRVVLASTVIVIFLFFFGRRDPDKTQRATGVVARMIRNVLMVSPVIYGVARRALHVEAHFGVGGPVVKEVHRVSILLFEVNVAVWDRWVGVDGGVEHVGGGARRVGWATIP